MHLWVDRFCTLLKPFLQEGLGMELQIYNLDEMNEAAASFSTRPETESSLAIFKDAAAQPPGTQDHGEEVAAG